MNKECNLNFGRAAFVCTTPLQFFSCVSLARNQACDFSAIFIVTQGIDDRDNFITFAAGDSYRRIFDVLHITTTRVEAAQLIRSDGRFDSIFVDCDRYDGFKLFSGLKKKHFVVYEEGFGTYLGQDFSIKGRFKSLVKRIFFGRDSSFGGARKTDIVFVHNVDLYACLNPRNAHKARSFPGPFSEFWHLSVPLDCMPEKHSEIETAKHVALMIGTWSGNSQQNLDQCMDVDLNRIIDSGQYDEVFLKKHPHDKTDLKTDKSVKVCKAWVPAEVLISRLAEKFSSVTVYHYSSSVSLYIGRELASGVRFVDLRRDKRFERVMQLVEAQDRLEAGS